MAAKKSARTPPKGRGVRQDKNGGSQVIRAEARWTGKSQALFLNSLATDANVRAAAEAAGFSTTTVYKHRRLDAGFAAAWEAALNQGYARVEAWLLETAAAGLSGLELDAERELPKMTVDQGMNLLRLHRAAVKGGPAQRYDARAKPVDLEAVRASILRKIDAIERAEARRVAKTGSPPCKGGAGGGCEPKASRRRRG